MKLDEMIAVIEAAKAGKVIQCRVADVQALRLVAQTQCVKHNSHQDWSNTCNNPPAFSFGLFDYRVLPDEEGKA